MAAPQLRGLGKRLASSAAARPRSPPARSIAAPRMVISTSYWRDDLVLAGRRSTPTTGRSTARSAARPGTQGGFAIYAHGGYAQAIYADFVQKNVDAVELLQFGVYRGIELADWYHILNIGYRFPCVGASDYPACRKLGDCQTYVYWRERPDFAAWLKARGRGRSFVTTGPMLLLEVDGERPGGIIRKNGHGPASRAGPRRGPCEVAPIQTVQIDRQRQGRPRAGRAGREGQGRWIELERPLELDRLVVDRGAGVLEGAFRRTRRRGAYQPGLCRISTTRPPTTAIRSIAWSRGSTSRWPRTASDASPRRRGCSTDFQKSRDILLQDPPRRAGCRPAAFPTPGSTDARPRRSTPAGGRIPTPQLEPVPPAAAGAHAAIEALKTFETVDGFRMELVAAEPLVQSPVAAAFDADGNLYVAEMRDYPYKPRPGKTPLGHGAAVARHRRRRPLRPEPRLRRRPALGRGHRAVERRRVRHRAARHLVLEGHRRRWPGRRAQKVYTGFGTQNQQAMVNNLTWGLDHWIYGAAAGNGGTIRPADDPQAHRGLGRAQRLPLRPETGDFEPVSRQRPVRQHVRRLGQPVHLRRVAPALAAGPAAPRAGAEPLSRGPVGGPGHRRRLGADLPDQPDRALATDPLEPADRPQHADPPNRPASAITSSTPARA